MLVIEASRFGGPEVLAARQVPDPAAGVMAAAGGIGVLLIQLARAARGQVIAAARGKRKLDAVRNAGEEAAVDYSEPRWGQRVRR